MRCGEVRLQLRDSKKKIHGDLQAVYGTNCEPYSTIFNWIQAFRSEESSSKLDTSLGRSFLARSEQNIDLVKIECTRSAFNHQGIDRGMWHLLIIKAPSFDIDSRLTIPL